MARNFEGMRLHMRGKAAHALETSGKAREDAETSHEIKRVQSVYGQFESVHGTDRTQVYKAVQINDPDHVVAIKFAQYQEDEHGTEVPERAIVDLYKEFELGLKLKEVDSPFIIRHEEAVYDKKKGLGIVTPWIEGGTLKASRDAYKSDIDTVASLGMQVALGLDALHSQGIIYRDLKLANIFVAEHNEIAAKSRFQIGDLNSSAFKTYLKKVQPVESPTVSEIENTPLDEDIFERRYTKRGVVVGTAGYVSPEQAKAKALTESSDLFALGTVLYTTLTGKHPFIKGKMNHLEILNAIIHGDAEPLQDTFSRGEKPTNHSARKGLYKIIRSLLEKDPRSRGERVNTSVPKYLGGKVLKKLIPDPPKMETAADVARAIAECFKDIPNSPVKDTLGYKMATVDSTE